MLSDNSNISAFVNAIAHSGELHEQEWVHASTLKESVAKLTQAIINLNNSEALQNLTIDSREVNSSSIFIALYGSTGNGHDYIDTAVQQGCQLVLAETRSAEAHFSVSEPHHARGTYVVAVFELGRKLPQLAAVFYQLPPDIELLAVTGTNGKTSVANVCANLYQQCNRQSASIGTLGVHTWQNSNDATHLAPHQYATTRNTTPDVTTMFKHLAQLSEQDIKHIVIEASSHGLQQGRLQGLPISTAIFTNLTQDHLDYHASMADYANAKRLLLNVPSVKTVVLNADDKESQHWAKQANTTQHIYWFAIAQVTKLEDEQALGCWAKNIRYSNKGSQFTLGSSWGTAEVNLPLIGHFNVSNLLASACALLANGESFTSIIKAIPHLRGVAGRMELFASNKASILVDYAHTPDALKQALIAARAHTSGKLICVFGCGGDRDTSKRAIMGAMAERYADEIWLTQDNSRSEPPKSIINDILEGIQNQSSVNIDIDRKQAIANAWHQSSNEDMILVAGKGHEDYMETLGQQLEYNERAYVQQLLNPSEPNVGVSAKESL